LTLFQHPAEKVMMLTEDTRTLATQAGFDVGATTTGEEIGVNGGPVFLTLTKEVERLSALSKAAALREASSMLDGGTAAARMLARMAGEYEDQARCAS
jgi:hypothetical protein